MRKQIITKYRIKIFVGISGLFLMILILIYATGVNQNPDRSEKFANFATYFNNMVMPFLTLITAIALFTTLRQQQIEFSSQQMREHLNSYLIRFEKKIEIYEQLAHTPIGYKTGEEAFSFRGIPFINNENAIEEAERLLVKLPIIMSTEDSKIKYLPVEDQITGLFTTEWANHGTASMRLLSSAYRFATKADYQLLYSMWQTAEKILKELKSLKIIDDKQHSYLKNMITIPTHLKE